MRMTELAVQYRESADLLTGRIRELRSALENSGLCEMEKYRLRGRIAALTSMCRQTRATAKRLEHYYDREVGSVVRYV